MKLNELTHNDGAKKRKMRVGRGIGSGKGKTSGRGVKGQKARTGVSGVRGFEGGQTALYRRLPKLGFSNATFRTNLVELTLARLQEAIDNKLIDTKKVVDEDALVKGKVLSRKRDGVKLLATGELKSKVDLRISKASKGAEEAVKKAGGSIDFIVIERKAVPRNHRKPRTAA
jgi:large subunit ribosomal protein L15